jgi:hypothetical protein
MAPDLSEVDLIFASSAFESLQKFFATMTFLSLLCVLLYVWSGRAQTLESKTKASQASNDFVRRPIHNVRKIMTPTKVSFKDTDLILWHPTNKSLLEIQKVKWAHQVSVNTRILVLEATLSEAFVAWSQTVEKGSVGVFVRADVLVDP